MKKFYWCKKEMRYGSVICDKQRKVETSSFKKKKQTNYHLPFVSARFWFGFISLKSKKTNRTQTKKTEKNRVKPKKTEPNRFEPVFVLKNRTETGQFEPVSV
jgi:hypothetical protein